MLNHFLPQRKQPEVGHFADHTLNVAAGTPVDSRAYERWSVHLNMMKVRALGEAYRKGWLHNVMARVTPMTVRNSDDYCMMADLFVTDAATASAVLAQMSRDMSAFAVAAGLYFSPHHTPPEMSAHMELYAHISTTLGNKFGFMPPEPFARTTIAASDMTHAGFVREFIQKSYPDRQPLQHRTLDVTE